MSGYSGRGGSTIALIRLTNQLNQAGYEAVFYGPHSYHRDKCRSGTLSEIRNTRLSAEDRVVAHYLRLTSRVNVKRVLFVSHEKWWFKVGEIKRYWDEAIFLHEEHRDYHSAYQGPYSLIPNFKESLVKKRKPECEYVAGIIGTIEPRKQTHQSIQRALNDGCEKVLLFGKIGDQAYFEKYVKPLLGKGVIHSGFVEDKQAMYDQLGRVYHTSRGEVACLVKDECDLTGTLFFGNEETSHIISPLSNAEILQKWLVALKY